MAPGKKFFRGPGNPYPGNVCPILEMKRDNGQWSIVNGELLMKEMPRPKGSLVIY